MVLQANVISTPSGTRVDYQTLATAGPVGSGDIRLAPPFPEFTPDMRVLYLASRHRLSANISRVSRRRSEIAKISRRRLKTTDSDFSSSVADGSELERCKTAESDLIIDGYEDIDLSDDENLNVDSSPNKPTPTEDKFQRVYLYMCRHLGVTASSSCLTGLLKSEISLVNYELGPKGVRACCVPLAMNPPVKKLDLTANSMGTLGATYVSEMLAENINITDINLADNCIGSEGARVLARILRTNDYIRKLNLSGNGFEEKDATIFADILRDNHTLKELNLSHNAFREKGGQTLGPALADNTSLEVLDLSWNHLRRKGAVAICDGLKNNLGLKRLNVAWNGFYLEGCKALHRALVANRTLCELDVSCNRIDRRSMDELLKGIVKNERLQVLKVGENPLTTEGALSILKVIEKKPTLPLQQLDITGQCVDANFIRLLEKIRETRELSVTYGNVFRHDNKALMEKSGKYIEGDPMMVLMEFMRLQNLRLVDLFISLDTDGSKTLTRQEFRDGLMKANIPVSPGGLDLLITKLDVNGDGEVDYGELIQGQKDHKRKIAKMLQKSKAEQVEFEDTELGRITSQLEKITAVRTAARRNTLMLKRENFKAVVDQVMDAPSMRSGTRRGSDVISGSSLWDSRTSDPPAKKSAADMIRGALSIRRSSRSSSASAQARTGSLAEFSTPGPGRLSPII